MFQIRHNQVQEVLDNILLQIYFTKPEVLENKQLLYNEIDNRGYKVGTEDLVHYIEKRGIKVHLPKWVRELKH